MENVTPEQKAEQQIAALRAFYDLFIDQLREIVRTEIAVALEGKSKVVSASDADTINATEEAKEIFTEHRLRNTCTFQQQRFGDYVKRANYHSA